MLVTQLAASASSFDEAKALADRHEALLNSPQMAQLLESQGQAAEKAFADCMPSPPPRSLPSFTVVLMLNDAGMPQKTWLRGDTRFAECVEERFADSALFQPPHAPFYTSFEFTFRP